MVTYLVEHLCKELDVHIVNGRCGYDCGNYTFISSQGKSLIDYVLTSPSLFNYILDFSILTTDILNHLQTITKLKICTRNRRLKKPVTCKLQPQLRFVWDVNSVNDFVWLLCDDQWRTLFQQFKKELNFDINYTIKILNDILYSAVDSMKRVSRVKRKVGTVNQMRQPDWWDRDCDIKKCKKYVDKI